MIAAFGTPEQQQRWLPRMASGETKMVFAITEPDAGSNSHKISTIGRRDGDVYLPQRHQDYISGVDEADAILLVDPHRHRRRRPARRRALAVPRPHRRAGARQRTPLPVSA